MTQPTTTTASPVVVDEYLVVDDGVLILLGPRQWPGGWVTG